ncbi:ABC transporter ATP-binding protein [Neorhizobium tomejilense]|uniref:ABC transporter ATP-binding protein n=1 Tax=Neorhizobium tomejilense TaxID=2093828 RepID=UPI003ECCB93C
MTELLEISGFCAGYGKIEVVRDLTLKVREGSIVTVIGPNGAGKTTLLNGLMGLLPARGVLRFAGRDVLRLPVEDRLGAGLCLVSEKRELFGEMSVEDNLLLGGYIRRKLRDGSQKEDMASAFQLFPRLRERKLQMAATLSGGERQMLAIARALMSRPKLLMLDEPSLGLAPLVVREVLETVSRLRDRGVSILIIEQNARAALNIADYGYVLESGAVAMEGGATKLQADDHVTSAYLGAKSKAS